MFCCFNNTYKITPAGVRRLDAAARAVPGSVLWLCEDNAAAEPICGARPQRAASIRIGSYSPAALPLADHLARHRLADLFLDTLPYNAHTTASDALWAGLPVVTCLGTRFAGRVAASMLSASACRSW